MSENYAALPDRDGGLRRGTPLQDCRAPRPRLDLTLRWGERDSNSGSRRDRPMVSTGTPSNRMHRSFASSLARLWLYRSLGRLRS
jgi:hypothetical protein